MIRDVTEQGEQEEALEMYDADAYGDDGFEEDPWDEDELSEAADQAARTAQHSDGIDVNVLTLLISRLAQLLAQEADLLDAMDMSAVAAMQDEKIKLVDALEKQKKLLSRRNQLREALSDEQREQLGELISIFEEIMQENYKRLLVAKEVNGRVVQAVKDMANEQARQSFYTENGERAGDPSVCFSLNQST
jgi:DNA-binding protein H-NS